MRGARSEKRNMGGIMDACILCDKLPVVCILPDSRKSKQTGRLTPLTFTKVRQDSDFWY